MPDILERVQQLVAAETPVALVTVVGGPQAVGRKLLVFSDGSAEGSLGWPELEERVRPAAVQLLDQGRSQTLTFPELGDAEVFVDVYPPPPTLLIFGGVHVGVALARFAKLLGFRVKVIDARGKFASPERFPDADEIVIAHAEDYLRTTKLTSSTYVAVLTHDPKLDDPAIILTLPSPARYVGAIGSKKTNAARRERLRAAGLSEEQLARLHGPIGLDLGARTPEEIALSIIAEIVAVKNGRATVPGRGIVQPRE